jgi:hypothetical protein
VLYDTVYTTDDDIVFLNSTAASAATFDPDLEIGAVTGETGICVDVDSSYNEGCNIQTAAFIKDGLIGCSDVYVGKFLCGLSVEIKHGDISTVEIAGNLIWPRVLIDGSQDLDGDGVADPAMSCHDPVDCTQK